MSGNYIPSCPWHVSFQLKYNENEQVSHVLACSHVDMPVVIVLR